MTTSILRIDASMRHTGSVTRQLADSMIARLTAANPGATVASRDLTDGVGFVTEEWIGAAYTPPADRTAEQRAALAESDTMIAELQAADTIVIAVPMYNFGLPGAFKAWFDQVARVGVTFKYTETGPVGLLQGKRVIALIATGGVEVGSAIDFATPHLRFILGFIGITDVTLIAADKSNSDQAAAIAKAEAGIAQLAA